MSAQASESFGSSLLQMEPAHGHSTPINGAWYECNSINDGYILQHNLNPIPPQTYTDLDAASPKTGRFNKRSSPVDRSFFCNECGATFSNSSNLKSHSRIHSGERPYVCDICGASFVQSSNMKAHKRIHTGERPYCCEECGQCFSRSSHLTGHKRTHTGERPYICGICNESFVTSTHLRNHMRKHTGERPFSCKTCKACFSQNSSLQIHLRIHTGERPYKCTCCSSAFRSRGDLRSHQKLHTDSRPFMCQNCEKSFKTKQYLCKHLKKCGIPPSGKKRGRPKKGSSSGHSSALAKKSIAKVRTPSILRKSQSLNLASMHIRESKHEDNNTCTQVYSVSDNQSTCSDPTKFVVTEANGMEAMSASSHYDLSHVAVTQLKL